MRMKQPPHEPATLAAALFEEVESSESAHSADVDKLENRARTLLKAARAVGASHTGSSFGLHHDLYYGDFEQPPFDEAFSVEWGLTHGIPPGWRQRRAEDVQ